MRLDAAEDRVRYRTQHVGDTTRLSQTRLREVLNRVYKQTRSKLQGWAPSQYVATSTNLVLATVDTIGLSAVALPFESIHRIDTKAYTVDGFSVTFDTWQKVERAGSYPDRHSTAYIYWEKRGLIVQIHPEGFVAGTFRVLYHYTPTDLSDPAHLFEIPPALDAYLITMAASEIYQGDRNLNEAKRQDDRAEKELEEALPILYREFGTHGDSSGLVELQGY